MDKSRKSFVGLLVSELFIGLDQALRDKHCRLTPFDRCILIESICIALYISISVQRVIETIRGSRRAIKLLTSKAVYEVCKLRRKSTKVVENREETYMRAKSLS